MIGATYLLERYRNFSRSYLNSGTQEGDETMPRKKQQQQTLLVPPGANPATLPGTPEAKAAMERVRAARAEKQKQKAATPQPVARPRPMAGALMTAQHGALADLDRLAGALMQGRLTGQLVAAQVVVLLMKGFELGLGAVEAVQSLYITVEGKVELQAELMRALILRAGVGFIVPFEMSETQVAVRAVRYGVNGRDDTEVRFVYSLEDAKQSGLLDGAGARAWQTYPRQMCFARATSEASRALFADVLLAAGYAYGEIEQRDLLVEEATPGQAVAPEAPEPTPEPTPAPTPEPAPIPEPAPEAEPAPKVEPPCPPANPAPPAPAEPRPGPEPIASARRTSRMMAVPAATPPPAAAEPVAAPEPAAPAPTPPPVATTPAGWPEGRAASHSFPVQGPRGEVRIVQTGGVRKEQIQQLLDITTARTGQPNWQGLQDLARAALTKLGVTLLTHLTQEEGTVLIRGLQSDALYQAPRGNGATDVRHEQLLDAMLAEVGALDSKPQVLALMERSYGTKDVNTLAPESFRKALVEMRSLASDPATFALMLEQILGQAATG